MEDQASEEFVKTLAELSITIEGWKKLEKDYKKLKKDTLSCSSMGEWLRGIVD